MNAVSPKPEIYGQALVKYKEPLRLVPNVDPPEPERGFHIGTYSGHWFYYGDIRVGDFHIEDIAHALAMKCRYNGHTERFYSVAEHCWWVSHNVPTEDALAGLLHDAAEAYYADVPSPMKWFLDQTSSALRDMEHKIERVLFEQFGLAWPRPGSVTLADRAMLYTEMTQLMRYCDMFVPANATVYGFTLECWSPERAEQEYLDRFRTLAS